MTRVHTIVPAHRSLAAGLGTGVLALGCAALTAGLVADPGLPPSIRIASGAIGALVVLAFWTGALRLARRRGGLSLDRGSGRVGVGLTGVGDVWWLPLSRLRGVRVSRRMPRDGDDEPLWTAGLLLAEGPEIVLSQGPERHGIEDVSEHVAEELGLEILPADPPWPAATPGRVEVRIHRRAALQTLLFLFGVSGAVLGGLLTLQFEEHPVFAILFAPVMLLLGVVLLATATVKRFGREVLEHRDGTWIHRWSLGPLRWGERAVAASPPCWRLRAEAVRGVCLELVGPEGTLVVGSGATTRSESDVEHLAGIPGRFSGPE